VAPCKGVYFPKAVKKIIEENRMKTVRQLLEAKGNRVFSVAPASPVYDALLIMAENRIGALVVLEGEHLVGIFSERDYAREVVLKGKTSRTTPVSDIMSTSVITVSPDHMVDDCMNLMSGKRIRHLPVLENDKVVGVLSIGDLVKETIAYQQYLIKQLESYIQS
jgi:CBS domain-containing protein